MKLNFIFMKILFNVKFHGIGIQSYLLFDSLIHYPIICADIKQEQRKKEIEMLHHVFSKKQKNLHFEVNLCMHQSDLRQHLLSFRFDKK